ncbi:lectin MOA-related protein [Cystobacter fuscus]
MSINALIEKHNPDRYKLTWNNDGTQMNLCADTGSWNWLYVSSTASATLFTIHKFYVLKSKIDQLFRRTWPSASIIGSQFKTGDAYYEAVSDAQARAIYNNSGLSAYVWTAEVFDCDDFSYVYKAQASRDAYASKAEYGYAVGVIFGRSPSRVHAVNVFIDTNATVRILEPQTGSIVAGKDWKDQEGEAYEPYFVLM